MSSIRSMDDSVPDNVTVWAYQDAESIWHCITCDEQVAGPGGHECEE